MGNKKKNGYDFASGNLFVYIVKRFRFLALVTGIAFIVSVIVSLVITPKYKSTVVLFPAASVPISQTLLSSNYSGSKIGITSFGEEEEAEQILQILYSEAIRDAVIKKFDLMEHYGIDSSSRYARSAITNLYRKNISFRRTEYLSIEISVLDKDRMMAANIANTIAALIDSTMNGIKRERAIDAFNIVAQEYQTLSKQISNQQDSLTQIRNLGVNDYERQVEVLTDGYAQALIKGNMGAARTIQDKLKLLSEYGSQYVSLRNYLELEQKQLSELRERYRQAKVEAEQNLPNKFIVDSAVPADKKSFPVRWLIVVISSVSAFVFALVVALFFDNVWKKVRKEI